MQSSEQEGQELRSDGENQEFTRVCSILCELKKQKYLSIFKENEITDEALDCIKTEEEMRSVLKDVKIPVGVAIRFSSKWFCNNTSVTDMNENVETRTVSTDDSIGISGAESVKLPQIKEGEQQNSIQEDISNQVPSLVEHSSGQKKNESSSHDKEKADNNNITGKREPLETDANTNIKKGNAEVHPLRIEKDKAKLQNNQSGKTTNSSSSHTETISTSKAPHQLKNGDTNQVDTGSRQHEDKSSTLDYKCDFNNAVRKKDPVSEVRKSACARKAFGVPVGTFRYTKGSIFMEEENREIEFKALTNESPLKLPWKIMEKARVFICGVLNAGGKGTIYFGIGDSYDKKNNFARGEVIGLEVEELKDEITKAFQSTLDDHIKSDDGKMKKGGDMNCVKIYFVPVEESGERTDSYVIEIEIKRDWKFCKDNVYYFQQWTEKRGTTMKGALSDLYKVNKDKWEDPTIRTCGPSTTVKNIDIDKHIKEPLTQKYKEWQDDVNRKQLKRLSSQDAAERVDVHKFSSDVRESLREINFKENSYILIANKVPPEHRGSTSLAFLQSIPWIAVFDLFDQNSKQDGLHFIFNETSDSARATVKELGDFKGLQTGEEISTRGTTWIFRSQSMHESDWTRNSKDCLYRALSAYQEQSPTGRIHCVFLGLSDEYLQEMADIIDSCFSIIGTNASKCITIMSEKKEVGTGIVKFLKGDIRRDVKPPCSIFGFPLELLKENVKEMLGPIQFEEPGATTDLPYLNGKPRPVLNKRLNSLTDLEVYFPKPKLLNTFRQMERARESFYMGDVIKQLNLFHNHDITRTRAAELTSRIDKYLKRLSDPSEVTRHVETVTLSYESGSGATTLCRRILWDKRDTYRCAVAKTISSNTDYQIDELQKFLYETSPSFIPPVLVLVDNFPEQQVRHLLDKMTERKTKCVLLNTIPMAKLAKGNYEDVAELGQLDDTEIERVKRVLVDVKNKDDRRREKAAQVLERERRFIWLGLELFGRQYIDIEPRLSKHIHDIISHNLADKLKDAYEMILRFCCLLDFYSKGRSIYPHPCAVDILYDRGGLDRDNINQIEKIHDKFGGLLLEDFSESEGYRGWRPAHFLVGEVVRKEMDLLTTAKKLVMEMNTGSSHARKFLTSDAVNVFLQREKKYDGTSGSANEPDFTLDGSIEDDVFGSLEVRTRYSALIIDVMSLNPDTLSDVTSALDLLITLNENVTTTQHKARTWQQIARVFAYEIGMKKISIDDSLVERINKLVCPGSGSRESPTNGFEVAHLVIDQAIKLQESYVHHVVTKGAFFLAELRDFREGKKHCSIGDEGLKTFIQQAIDTSKKAIDVYDTALTKTLPDGYLHAMVGKIHTVIVLLEILKKLPFFAQHNEGPDESFKNYMSYGIHPHDLKAMLSPDDLEYFMSLKSIAIQLSNDLFREIKLRRTQSYNAYEVQELTNAKIRALKLRKRFYQVTGLDRTHLKDDAGCKEDVVNDFLFQHNETPYSGWENLPPEIVSEFYTSLKNAIPKETVSHDTILVCARAGLQEKVNVDELSSVVELWCQRFPRSVWAHMFNYMLRFPVPNGSLKANVPIVKASVDVCKSSIPHSRQGHRRSGAEYLLGKGIGLHSIMRPYEVSKDSQEMKTKFWRSKDVYEKLERLRGQKILDRKGILTYKGIEIVFDNERYPKQSRDDLWFCLGFTVNGPYAYDPIEEDVYRELKRLFCEQKWKDVVRPSAIARDPCTLAVSSSEGTRVKKMLSHNGSKASSPRSSVLDNGTSVTSESTSAKATASPTDTNYKNPLPKTKKNASPSFLKAGNIAGSQTEDSWKSNRKLIIRKRSVEGLQKTFTPKWIDNEGRIHHGACVKRMRKSTECRTHTKDPVPEECNFAHPWKGDTLQHVCQLCTKDERMYCNKKNEHSRHIFDLGEYLNEAGEIWRKKDTEK